VDLRIDAGSFSTTATSTRAWRAPSSSVGSNACGNYSLGDDVVNDSVIAYTVAATQRA
jgi:hypothetical protein